MINQNSNAQNNGQQGSSIQWEELTAAQISELARRERSVAVVPLASIEQHGPHLPTGTDTLLATHVCRAAAQRCVELEIPAVVTPCLWLGRSFHHFDLGGTLSARLETFIKCIEDISSSLRQAGFRRQVFVNGHGGNMSALDSAVQEIGALTDVRPLALTYFTLAHSVVQGTRQSPEGGMGHACEFETSIVQHLRPELVGIIPDSKPHPPIHSALRRDMFAPGEATMYQGFAEMAENGAVGLPRFADVEKGELWFNACAQRLAEIITEYSSLPLK